MINENKQSRAKFVSIKWAIGEGIIEQNKVIVIAPTGENPLVYAEQCAKSFIEDIVSGDIPLLGEVNFELKRVMFTWAIFSSVDSEIPERCFWNWNHD